MKKIIVKWFKTQGKPTHLYSEELKVIESNHPRHAVGTRFDFGFCRVANVEGYIVEIHPLD